MSDEQKQRRGSAIFWVPIVILTILYVLSVGPADMLVRHGYLNPEAARAAYAPVKWLYENSMGARRVFDWYLSLWAR